MLSGRAPRGESILPIKSHARVGLSALANQPAMFSAVGRVT
jgi:hypothetical protein